MRLFNSGSNGPYFNVRTPICSSYNMGITYHCTISHSLLVKISISVVIISVVLTLTVDFNQIL